MIYKKEGWRWQFFFFFLNPQLQIVADKLQERFQFEYFLGRFKL